MAASTGAFVEAPMGAFVEAPMEACTKLAKDASLMYFGETIMFFSSKRNLKGRELPRFSSGTTLTTSRSLVGFPNTVSLPQHDAHTAEALRGPLWEMDRPQRKI